MSMTTTTSNSTAKLTTPYVLPSNYNLSRSSPLAISKTQEIYNLLQTDAVYWGKDRNLETVGKQVERAWSVLMLFNKSDEHEVANGVEGESTEGEGELIGVARVVSDGIGMGYLCDVVISPLHTKLGLAKFLVREACNNTDGEGNSKTWKWFLWTKDAHKVYEKEGFVTCGSIISNGWAMDRW